MASDAEATSCGSSEKDPGVNINDELPRPGILGRLGKMLRRKLGCSSSEKPETSSEFDSEKPESKM
jgi:hypothetical protein